MTCDAAGRSVSLNAGIRIRSPDARTFLMADDCYPDDDFNPCEHRPYLLFFAALTRVYPTSITASGGVLAYDLGQSAVSGNNVASHALLSSRFIKNYSFYI